MSAQPLPVPRLEPVESRVRTRLDRVYELWAARPCFVCGALGRCAHRELAADLAAVDAELDRAQAPPVRLEVL